MLGEERVVIDEDIVNAGEVSVGDDVGDEDSGVINVDKANAGEALLSEYEDILTVWMMRINQS